MAGGVSNVIAGATGVIPAAGLGSRLALDGILHLKPLLPLAGRSLIHRAIDSLVAAGCTKIVIVLGHEAEEVRKGVLAEAVDGVELVFELNPRYRLSNGVSVLAARPHVGDRFILMMADHLLERSIMELAGSHEPPPGGATLLVDTKIDDIFDLDDATKVQAKGGRIIEIGKSITRYNCIDTGVFVCSPAFLDALAWIYESRGDVSISDGVAELAAAGRMNIVEVGEARWHDVDNMAMFEVAENALSTGLIKTA